MRLASFIFLYFFMGFLYAKPVELVMWHSLAGQTGDEVRELVADFNLSQKNFAIKLIYKGEYTEALTSFAAAFRAKQPPALVQIFEVGKATMLHPRGIIKPIEELMNEQGIFLPKASFLPALRDFYSVNSQLVAMPFNSSIPVVFYNADLLKKLGYAENDFPHTWDEMENLAAKLHKTGSPCVLTSAYPGWILIESFSAIHGLPMIDKKSSKATYNNKAIINHLERLKSWQHAHYFEYGGRASDATVLFTSGRCAMFAQSSGSYNGLKNLVDFRVGVALLPLDTRVSKIRANNLVGGAALWAVAGQKPIVYQGIAQFISYISQSRIQERWHQQTGYLPLGVEGIYSGLVENSQHPVLALAQIDLASKTAKVQHNSGPQNQIRTINDEALEAIFAGIKTPKQAMDAAVKEANFKLLRFFRNAGE
ncbi:MAG: extracellular solute-binding protein [Tatlockia sp.]|nr:extracellular solute-binding protein [Tatlockia sp.]